jgi:DNA-binding response OmpR family regulator
MKRALITHHDNDFTRQLALLLERKNFSVSIIPYPPAIDVETARTWADTAVILPSKLKTPDGEFFSAWLRKQADCAIMVICDRGEDLYGVMEMEAGADGYMTQPLNHREFMERLKSIMRRYAVTTS